MLGNFGKLRFNCDLRRSHVQNLNSLLNDVQILQCRANHQLAQAIVEYKLFAGNIEINTRSREKLSRDSLHLFHRSHSGNTINTRSIKVRPWSRLTWLTSSLLNLSLTTNPTLGSLASSSQTYADVFSATLTLSALTTTATTATTATAATTAATAAATTATATTTALSFTKVKSGNTLNALNKCIRIDFEEASV